MATLPENRVLPSAQTTTGTHLGAVIHRSSLLLKRANKLFVSLLHMLFEYVLPHLPSVYADDTSIKINWVSLDT